jgi:hypothetical protein
MVTIEKNLNVFILLKGVRLGSVLSSTLFNMVKTMVYADDTMILEATKIL